MNTQVATIPQHRSLVAKFAAKYTIEQDKLLSILRATAFKVKDGEVSNEQMAALLVVADQYGLNPFTREIFAFPDKQNGIVPVVGVDGWSRIVNDHPESDGFEFREAEDMVTLPDAKPCPKWMEVVIYRKDRKHPIVVREYIDEVYRPLGSYSDGNKHKPGPWQTHTKRFLRHKVFIQGARIAYGFGGIYDEDEAQRIIEREINPVPEPAAPSSRSATARLAEAVGAGKPADPLADSGKAPEITLEAAIDGLGAYADDATLGLYADSLPDAVRGADAFAKAVKKRLEEIKEAGETKAAFDADAPSSQASKDGKKPGTPKLRKSYVEKLSTCSDADTLDVIYDETRMFVWAPDDQAALTTAFETRKAGIAK